MAESITLTAAMRNNLLSLQKTQTLLDVTQNRLATGRKVNSALDNANAFFAAQALDFRANDLTRLLDGMGQSIQTLKAADAGITALTKLVEQAQSVAQTAKDTASGGAVALGTVALTSAQQASLTTIAGIAANDTFTLQAGTGNPTTTFTITAGQSVSSLINQINSTSGFAAQLVDATATTSTTDRLIEVRTTNGQNLITTDAGGVLAALGVTVGTTVAANNSPPDQIALQANFDSLLTQIDDLAADSGYRGTNLLDGDSLSVDFNEDGTSTLNVTGADLTSSGLNITAANFSSDANIQTSLDQLSAALDTLRSRASSFGANLTTIQTRQDFTKDIINTLQEGRDKLTLADQNEEGAKLLSLQTSQQLGVTALSLSAQAQQSVLRLF